MSQADPPDSAAWRGWIGRLEQACDVVTPRLVHALCATLDLEAAAFPPDAAAPLMLHWCLAPVTAKASAIGSDGHPQAGSFLPPLELPRRMWAGGDLIFHDPLRVGDTVEKQSSILDISVKSGRSGQLCFVTVQHEFSTPRGCAISERQEIVYRPMVGAAPHRAPAPQLPEPQWQRAMQADPVLLFRYSALTFNSHRIHYDLPYTTAVEGYPGLLVHAPLQATLLAQFAASLQGTPPKNFNFRAVAPLFACNAFQLCAAEREAGLDLWIRTDAGVRTLQAKAGW